MTSSLRGGSRRLLGAEISLGQKVELNDEYMVKTHALNHIQTVIEAKFENAQSEYDAIITKAQDKARLLLEQAQVESQRLIEEEGLAQRDAIREAAYQEGYQEGFQKITEECTEKTNLCNQLLQQTQTMHQEWTEKAKVAFLNMAKVLAETILNDRIESHPEYLAKHLEHAQDKLLSNLSTGQAVIHLHPDSFQLIQATVKKLDQLQHLDFKTDTKYPKNRLYLDTRESIWDISPQTQLSHLVESFSQPKDGASCPSII